MGFIPQVTRKRKTRKTPSGDSRRRADPGLSGDMKGNTMISTNAEAITAAASYVAENDEVFTAAYNENIDKVRGNSARTVRDALRSAVRGGYDQFGTVKLAAAWLVNSRYFDGAVTEAVRNGTLPRGTSAGQARTFLGNALGVRPAPAAAQAPAAVRHEDGPRVALRDELAEAIAGVEDQDGQVKITIEGSVSSLRELGELLGL